MEKKMVYMVYMDYVGFAGLGTDAAHSLLTVEDQDRN